MILHSVYFYFKEDIPADAAGKMELDIRVKLSQIHSVNQIWAGPPQGIDRDVVDNDYAMSLHATFKDSEGLQSYQEDPAHKEFLETWKPYFERIQVYDTRIS